MKKCIVLSVAAIVVILSYAIPMHAMDLVNKNSKPLKAQIQEYIASQEGVRALILTLPRQDFLDKLNRALINKKVTPRTELERTLSHLKEVEEQEIKDLLSAFDTYRESKEQLADHIAGSPVFRKTFQQCMLNIVFHVLPPNEVQRLWEQLHPVPWCSLSTYVIAAALATAMVTAISKGGEYESVFGG